MGRTDSLACEPSTYATIRGLDSGGGQLLDGGDHRGRSATGPTTTVGHEPWTTAAATEPNTARPRRPRARVETQISDPPSSCARSWIAAAGSPPMRTIDRSRRPRGSSGRSARPDLSRPAKSCTTLIVWSSASKAAASARAVGSAARARFDPSRGTSTFEYETPFARTSASLGIRRSYGGPDGAASPSSARRFRMSQLVVTVGTSLLLCWTGSLAGPRGADDVRRDSEAQVSGQATHLCVVGSASSRSNGMRLPHPVQVP